MLGTQFDDDLLGELLRSSGAGLGPAEAREVVAGVAAAPAGADEDGWMALVARSPSRALHDVLQTMLAEARRRSAQDEDRRQRLAMLRAELRSRRLSGFIVPRGDEHQGEYIPAHSERLAWLTGFTGSAGIAVVLREQAALFVDGRYTTQAAAEVDPALFTIRHVTHEPLQDWLADVLPAGARVGYDPWLHTVNQVTGFETACRRVDARAVAVDGNPIDAIWADQPPPPVSPVVVHDPQFAHEDAASKRERVATVLRSDRQDAAVLAQPESIAWLLNIRGGDVPFTPLALAFALIRADSPVVLLIDPRKLTDAVRAHLGEGVSIRPLTAMPDVLDALAAERGTVRIDPDGTPAWIVHRLKKGGGKVVEGADPCALPRAKRTEAQLASIRAAHVRDGAALTRFLAWLARTAPHGGLDEIAAARRLAEFRSTNAYYQGPSFPTISGAGPNGAIVHYRVSPETNRALEPQSLYLVDSGAQYLDGTTDVTRTVAIGTPTDEMRHRFTLVLKGHVAIGDARFPRGTTGSQLDVLARMAMWRAGLDYDHGTGHGVGFYLGVHEGPQRISKLPSRVALEPGMIVSNEPGYYKPGAFGIRIENLVAVKSCGTPDHGEHEMLGFETLTLAPIDRTLIDVGLLDAVERAWVDGYHEQVRTTLAPLLDADTTAWLDEVTRPLEP